jgi:hypothetical protein
LDEPCPCRCRGLRNRRVSVVWLGG